MDFKQKPIADLIPYPRNARTHSDEQVAQIAASIREFGFLVPVLVDADNGIIAGHGRVLAARKLGMDTVPTIEAAHLSETQKRAFILADNKLTLNAGWDDNLLGVELHALLDDDFDLDLTGFNGAELSELMYPGEATDPNEEWQGMPEFDQQDKEAFRTITIHFKDQEAVDEFARLIGQKITEHARFVWFPEIEIERYADKEYKRGAS